jgi:hypothetical protein
MQLHVAAKPPSRKTVSADIQTIHAYARHHLNSKIVRNDTFDHLDNTNLRFASELLIRQDSLHNR